jgi:two-component system response regulator YesN
MKLMVVDDEPLILNGIIRMIKKGNTPFTEIIGAADGFEALQILEQFQPDLIITDIHMPEMDGLQLIQEIKLRNGCDRFVILTGYNDFEYARQALRNHVIDYLLKPINKEELLTVLAKIVQSIQDERNRTNEHDSILLKEHVFFHTPNEEMLITSKQLRTILPYPSFTVIGFLVAEEGYQSLIKRLNEINASLKTSFEKVYLLDSPFLRQAVLLLNSSKKPSDEQLQQICNELFHPDYQLECKVSIGISIKEDALLSLHELYVEAIAALFFNRYFSKNHLMVYTQEELKFYNCYNSLVQIIESPQERTPSVEQIRKVMQPLLVHFTMDASRVNKIQNKFLIYVSVYLQSIGLSLETIWMKMNPNELFSAFKLPMDEIQLVEIVAQVIRTVHRPEHKQPNSYTIDKIVIYVKQNYTLDLSLDLLAEQVNMHPNYISMLFKKEMNTTFLQYLHTYRIKKAKDLMHNHPEWPIHTVAEKVGYENPRHFFKVFKKYEKLTPGRFRLVYPDA